MGSGDTLARGFKSQTMKIGGDLLRTWNHPCDVGNAHVNG
jgi:hypothetical protein